MKINVIIPNYNGAKLIEKNLPYVVAAISNYKNTKIIIVDDGSNKEDVESLERFLIAFRSRDKIIFLKNEKNLGFSSNMNRGILKSDADYLVFLNSDVNPEKDFLKHAIPRLKKDNNIFGVGCMDKSVEGADVVLRGRGVAKWSRGILVHSRGEVDQDDTFWISGGSSVVSSSIVKRLGGFDTLFDPFYWEDIDLSYRARKSGYGISFEKRSVVLHRHEEGAIKKHFSKKKVMRIAYRNQFIFIWKNISDFEYLLSHFLWLPYHILTAILRGDKEFIAGLLLALLRIPVIIKHRKLAKKLFILKDSEIINK